MVQAYDLNPRRLRHEVSHFNEYPTATDFAGAANLVLWST